MSLGGPNISVGLGIGILGALAILAYVRVNRKARGRGAALHWGLGWLLGFSGMLCLAGSWVLLGFSEPRYSSVVSSVAGLLVLGLSFAIYLASARHVGRWRRPSRYSLGLYTGGIHGRLRHPQALSLCLAPLGLALFLCSIPLLSTVPVWIAYWTLYTYSEEKHELIPAFGYRYLRYSKVTPRLLPRLRGRRGAPRRHPRASAGQP